MSHIRKIATGALVTAGLGLAALGIGSGVADAAPISSTNIAQWHGWGPPPPGPGWRPGPVGWGGPPPPPFYGGGYGWAPPPPPCVSGPLGFVHVCA
jgi:hypothetical protein